jgi:hypothetical protein
MARPDISRRTFLAVSGGLAAAATLWPELAAAHHEPEPLGKGLSARVLSSDLHASPAPQRVVFGLGSKRGYVSGPPVRVGFAPPDTTGEVDLTLDPTRLYKGGLPKGRGIYVAEPILNQPGVWPALALVRERQIEFAIEVKPAPEAPQVGDTASRAPSPTTTDTLEVKPMCTRRPQCPLHAVSLADAIGAGTPVAVLFATPARCQSEYCGPVLDTLLSIRGRYEDAVTFVHVEIYLNNRTTDVAPTVAAWGLPSEPWLYTVDAAGTIVGALDGAFGKAEMVRELDTLV